MYNPHTASTDSIHNSDNIKIQINILLPNSCATPHQKQAALTSSLHLIQQHVPSLHFHLQQIICRINTKSQGNQILETSPSKSACGVQKLHAPGQVGDYVLYGAI